MQVYIGAVNFGPSEVTLPLAGVEALDQNELKVATVIVSSSNLVSYYPHQKVELTTGKITLLAEQGVVFKFPM